MLTAPFEPTPELSALPPPAVDVTPERVDYVVDSVVIEPTEPEPFVRRRRDDPTGGCRLAKITAVEPATACWTPNEMLGVALGRITHSSPEDGAVGNV